jgi:hypothetical protein
MAFNVLQILANGSWVLLLQSVLQKLLDRERYM